MFWFLILGVFTALTVADDSPITGDIAPLNTNTTMPPELKAAFHDLEHCFEDVAGNKTPPTKCHNVTEFENEIQNYVNKFAEVHKNQNQTLHQNERNIDLLIYALNNGKYADMAHMNCMNFTSIDIHCTERDNATNSTNTRDHIQDIRYLLFAPDFEYKTAACRRANKTKTCAMKWGFTKCEDKFKEYAADLFDYSIERCVNATFIPVRPSSATGKYPLPLLIASMVITMVSVFAMPPASN